MALLSFYQSRTGNSNIISFENELQVDKAKGGDNWVCLGSEEKQRSSPKVPETTFGPLGPGTFLYACFSFVLLH